MILSTDNKEILLPPTVSTISGLALLTLSATKQGTSSAGEDVGLD